MIKEFHITVSPADASDNSILKKYTALHLHLKTEFEFEITRRSIDARSKNVRIQLHIRVYINESPPKTEFFTPEYHLVKNAKHVAIIGCGPAGIFAALTLLENGIKPVLFERGKDVRARRHDLATINKKRIVNPESNYCFGEGGAGTFSDGKLYTRSDKRGNVKKVLQTFVRFGASPDILIDAHPHIGTNKLPQIIIAMREAILNAGGEIHFNSRLTDIKNEFGVIKNIQINNSETFDTEKLILATGHSARDIFTLLNSKNILLEAKPFALGVRIEHPQQLIDKIQYHTQLRNKYLPPASYSITKNIDGRGVYSFCMCPGGIIAPCATSQDEIVTNGWSPSKRNNPYANSGFVVSVGVNDLKKYEKHNALAAMYFQKEIEQNCFIAGGKTGRAPAQRMEDFMNKNISTSLPRCSYQPGIISAHLNEILPQYIYSSLQKAFREIKKTFPLYVTNEAVCVAVESRTSSPVKIVRDKSTLQHPQVKGLFPCGEGAGYAGGIISAAMDGIKVAETISNT